jgi:predicted transcriptional regulator of viral defense system
MFVHHCNGQVIVLNSIIHSETTHLIKDEFRKSNINKLQYISMANHDQYILDFARQYGIIRPRDLVAQGIPRVALSRLVRLGMLSHVGWGLYEIPDRPVSEHSSLAQIGRKYPQAIVCLLSALRLHDLTTHSPFEVWLAISNKARAPKMDYPPLRVVRLSGATLIEGIENHQIDGTCNQCC